MFFLNRLSFAGIFFALGLTTLGSGSYAFDPPRLTGPVMDEAQIIDASDKEYLDRQIRELYRTNDIQIQILTLKSLNGEPIEQVSIDTTDVWKLGKAETDKGLLILVAPNERKTRIEVGQGLEGDLPDLVAHQIIQQKMLPAFRHGDYGKGLIAAVGTIEAILVPHAGDKPPLQPLSPKKKKHPLWVLLVQLAPVILVVLLFIFGGRDTRMFLLGFLLAGDGRHHGGWSGRGGGGFGGGSGGWGGGGGGFSGGGSSGGW